MNTIGDRPGGVTESEFNRFIETLHAKMEKGAREYGDASLNRPLPATLIEIEAELVDVCGWSAITLVRLWRLRERAVQLEMRTHG